jgi:hypothetical protein
MKLHHDGAIAVALPQPIGDSLIALVLVENLVRNGYEPVVFGWVAEQLADWFPHITVGRADDYRAAFDTVIEVRPTSYASSLSRSGSTLCLDALPEYGGSKHMIERIVDIAVNVLHLNDVTRSNGMVVPASVARGRVANRVVIHPTGSHPEKMWGSAKFLALSRVLTRRQMQPSFLVSPDELADWRDIATHRYEINALSRLSDVATWIAESAWFIGNDSGLGHLASSIGVPTLTLFMRRGLARSWRPGWGPGAVALPPAVLPFGGLRERLWKRLLTVRRVSAAFHSLRAAQSRAGFQQAPVRGNALAGRQARVRSAANPE